MLSKKKDDRDLSTKMGDLVRMDPKERGARTHKLDVYNCLTRLNRAIHEAKKAEVEIGPVGELDLTPFYPGVQVDQKLEHVGMGRYEGR